MSLIRVEVKVDGKIVEVHEMDLETRNQNVLDNFYVFTRKLKKAIGDWTYNSIIGDYE